MIQDHPSNILDKINTIQDNINTQNITKKTAFLPFFPQNENSNFNSINITKCIQKNCKYFYFNFLNQIKI